MSSGRKIVALCGGIGGAKLALGLASLKPEIDLSVVVNTGDDFDHFGLCISPDIDTVTYTLAGVANPETGWGRAEESWAFMDALAQLGGETWFRLGDKDLALNVLRTNLLSVGESLSTVTASIADKLGVSTEIIPMTDSKIRTMLQTNGDTLAFQDYFVRLQCAPVVTGIEFRGASVALPAPRFLELLSDPTVAAFVICPSNPFISIDPILSIPSVRTSLTNHRSPVVAVSPVIDGKCIKGPTSKLMAELGLGSSTADIAKYYSDVVDGFVIDHNDSAFAAEIEDSGIKVGYDNIMMSSLEERRQLAGSVIEFALTS